MYRSLSKKIIHIIIVVIIVFVILSIAGILALRYQVEGETNLPFKITKISIIETVEGTENENIEGKWNLNVNQNNDIYIYIEKSEEYKKTEVIENVEINNITINKYNDKGEVKLYKPVSDEKRMFKNIKDNEIENILYTGDLESNIKEQKISNQGGIVAFRYAINNISQYISDTNEEINHSQLLKLTNVKPEDLQTKMNFDIMIKLKSAKTYKATVELQIPTDTIIEEGTKGIEITDLDNIIFKRIEN